MAFDFLVDVKKRLKMQCKIFVDYVEQWTFCMFWKRQGVDVSRYLEFLPEERMSGVGHRWRWRWKPMLLRSISRKYEKQEYEAEWSRLAKLSEERFWQAFSEKNNRVGRPLNDKESLRLEAYEKKYTSIRVFYLEGNQGIPGACYDYTLWEEECKEDDDSGRCNVMFIQKEYEDPVANPIANAYLLEKLYNNPNIAMELITEEDFPFWYSYLLQNQEKIIFVDTWLSHRTQYEEAAEFFQTGIQKQHKSTVSFSNEEEQRGRAAMKNLGITDEYVCIFARDSVYYEKTIGLKIYQIRDSDINAFSKTTDYLWGKNIKTVRMGAVVASEYNREGAVDYSNQGRTEFLDCFLFANCRFFIGSNSGISGFSFLFGRNRVAINIEFPMHWYDRYAFFRVGIFVKYYDPAKKKYLRLCEIIALQAMYVFLVLSLESMRFDDFLRQQHIEIIHNTAEEILDVTKEMEAILNHSVQYTEHDEELQRRYREIVSAFSSRWPQFAGIMVGRIGRQWLRDNEWFLE